uniref:Uncharacterized protein n=1 Tax=Tanacetum cinerariifolium TaxID=118510 RepID=A0A699GT21_TANCI|nr:hypothetical protein [Tanacetum cinerariifolium]
MTLASSAEKPSKTFDELMSTPIYFFAFIMNDMNINNLTEEKLLGPAFRLLKGTCSNYAELEYDLEECYKALLEKLDWKNPEGGDYPFDLTKPLHLVKIGNHQKVPVDYFFNNVLNYLQGGISTMTYTTSLTKINATQYDLPGDDIYDFAIALRMFTRSLVIQKRIEDLQLGVKSYQNKINVTRPETTKSSIGKRDPYTPCQDPQGFIYVDNSGRNRLLRSDELYKFDDGTLTRLRTSPSVITKNIRMDQNRRDLPKGIPLDSVVVLGYEKRSKSKNKGKVPTEMELVLEQTQQGTSYEVLVSAEGVKELKRKVKINGEKKESLLTLTQKPAGNPVKEILFKLNLPDHMSILRDSKVTPTKHGEITKPYSSPNFFANCFISGICKDRHGDQEKYEHVGPKVTRSQDGEITRLCKEIMLG